jgi:hypothetical protein
MKTCIAYGTRWGSTRKTAELLAACLKDADKRQVDVVNAMTLGSRKLSLYDNFVIGSSIAAGMWKGGPKRLLAKLAGLDKSVAVFVSAGGVIHGRASGSAPDAPAKGTLAEREAKAIGLYIDPVCEKAGLKPVAKAAFGGRMSLFGKERFDSWDAEPIRAWAAALAGILR